MTAVVVPISAHRSQEFVDLFRGLLEHAERGEVRGFCGEIEDQHGEKFIVLLGRYSATGMMSDLGFRLQMKAAGGEQEAA